MLPPEYLETVGEEVAQIYLTIENEILAYLTDRLLSLDPNQMTISAVSRLSRQDTFEIRRIINSHKEELDKAVEKTVTKALTKSDKDDMKTIKEGEDAN